jgi:hypothetical protein
MALLFHLRQKRTLGWALALALLAAGLCFVPLFNLLGYEFCLALGLAGSLAGAHLGTRVVAAARRHDEGVLLSLDSPARVLARLLGRAVLGNLLLLLPPLAIISLNALRVKNCDLPGGLALFAMMPLSSTALASAGGVLWGLALPRPALASAGALLTVPASLGWGLWRFYSEPPIFAYDPFVGYFSGSLYDESITIGAAFLLYRLYNLAWLAALCLGAALLLEPAALRLRLPRRRAATRRVAALLSFLACLAAAATLSALRAPLGFAVDARQIQRRLGGVRRSPHFSIYHPREMAPGEVDLLAQDCEFRQAQLRLFFGAAPGRMRVYVFRSSKEKRALMGAGRTFIAKPWRREIYIQQAGFPHHTLKHELAHLFAGPFGDPLFGVSLRWRALVLPRFNVGLIEGLAVAADWRAYGEATAHQRAAALVRLKLAPPARRLFGAGFLTQASGRAYTLAGSICRYLVQRHGVARLLRAYRSGGDFAAAYGGQDLDALLARYDVWLARVQVPRRQLQLAVERFRRPSILRRVCAHEVANLQQRARDLAGRHRLDAAAAVQQQICSFDPSDPGHLLDWMRSLAAAGRSGEARELSRRLLSHPALSKPLQRQGLELLGDLAWQQGDRAAAATWYRRAGELAAEAYQRRVLQLKRLGLQHDSPEVRRVLRRYIAPGPGNKRDPQLDLHLAHRLQRLLPASGLGLYLQGKQLAGRNHCAEAATALERALALGLPGPDFVVEAHRTRALCQYRAADYAGARGTLQALLRRPGLAAGTRLEALDLLQRVRWRTGNAIETPLPAVTPLKPADDPRP